METIVIGDAGVDWIDTPRALTNDETAAINAVGYLQGIKLHRQFTHSTLRAAVAAVKSIQCDNRTWRTWRIG